MVNVTSQAVEEIKRLLDEQKEPGIGLRVIVKPGGCSGVSYGLGFDKEQAGDRVLEVNGIKVFVDATSNPFLEGTTLDFVDTCEGRGFKFLGANSGGGCGCGH